MILDKLFINVDMNYQPIDNIHKQLTFKFTSI